MGSLRDIRRYRREKFQPCPELVLPVSNQKVRLRFLEDESRPFEHRPSTKDKTCLILQIKHFDLPTVKK